MLSVLAPQRTGHYSGYPFPLALGSGHRPLPTEEHSAPDHRAAAAISLRVATDQHDWDFGALQVDESVTAAA